MKNIKVQYKKYKMSEVNQGNTKNTTLYSVFLLVLSQSQVSICSPQKYNYLSIYVTHFH